MALSSPNDKFRVNDGSVLKTSSLFRRRTCRRVALTVERLRSGFDLSHHECRGRGKRTVPESEVWEDGLLKLYHPPAPPLSSVNVSFTTYQDKRNLRLSSFGDATDVSDQELLKCWKVSWGLVGTQVNRWENLLRLSPHLVSVLRKQSVCVCWVGWCGSWSW